VLEAIGAGERAAVAINERLSQDVPAAERSRPFWRDTLRNDTPFDPETASAESPRLIQETVPVGARGKFDEVELPVDMEQALKECGRCLRCDYRVVE
jgi:NADH-quinone oxidoreductase subunit F